MFGTWISDVQQELSARYPADRSYTAGDLKSPPMPTAVGHFLRHALQRRAARIEFSVESDWFDANAEDVQAALESYREALTFTARYPSSVWKSSLERAVQFVISYVAEPATGLVSFVFGETSQPIPVERVRERLEYFGTSLALREIIVGYLERKGLEEIEPADLRALVLKADKSLVGDYDADNWTAHLAPLFEMAALLPREDEAEVALPTDLLRAFFEAKDCEEIVRRIEAVESVKGVRTLDLDAVRKVVGVYPEPVVEEPEPEAKEVEVKPTPKTRVVRNDTHRDAKSSVVPRWMQFAGAPPREPGPLEVDDPESVGGTDQEDFGMDVPGKIGQRAPIPDELGIVTTGDGMEVPTVEPNDLPNRTESVPRWTQFQGSAAPTATPSVATVSVDDALDVEKRVLGPLNAVQRAWFVNHLFGSDTARWRAVIELLAEADDWNEASGIIATEVFERHDVDIYSRPAVDFTNAVEARMR